MRTFLQDLRFGARLLLKNPGFAVGAILTLALGIGANTAIFSVVDGVLLRPLPYPEPDRVIRIYGSDEQGTVRKNVSPMDFRDWESQSVSFESLGVFSTARLTDTGGDEPEQLTGLRVTPGFFPALGVIPEVGRTFLVEEAATQAAPFIVLSNALWQRRFAGDPTILGEAVTFEEGAYTVVGVMPAGFFSLMDHSAAPDFWTNLRLDPARHGRGGHWLRSVGRLKPDVEVAGAQAEIDTLMRTLEAEYPDTNTGERALLVPVHEALVGDIKPLLTVIFFAVGFVLLIACSNVANLVMSRAASRNGEVAIRAALGAGRSRLVRQLLTENLLLAGLGGVGGLFLAAWGLDVLLANLPEGIPRAQEIGIDARVLGFSLVASIVTGMLFGLGPALRLSARNLHESLKEGTRWSIGFRNQTFRNLMVVTQVALAMILVTGAVLFVRSFSRLATVDPGFQSHNTLSFRLSLPRTRYPEPAQVTAFYARALERVRNLPGVHTAGAIDMPPLDHMWSCDLFALGDRPPVPIEQAPCVESRTATPGYFRTMGIDLLEGRLFTPSDHQDSAPVALINRAMADLYWPDGNPIGKRVKWGVYESEIPWRTVVGVVANVRHFGLDRDAMPEVILPQLQSPKRALTLVLSSGVEPTSLIPAVREAIRSEDSRLALVKVRTMDEAVASSIGSRRFGLLLVGTFGILALILAMVGIYGVISYSVNQQTRELGIRMVLGARRQAIYRMVLGHGLALTTAGIVLGLVGSLALTRFISSMLYGITPTDPATYVTVILLLALASLLASGLPAWRATRVNPVVALRYE